jgi:chromosome segregation ATPase
VIYKIIFEKKDIDKYRVTWLIMAFVFLAFPIIGNMTIEWGDFKVSWKRLTEEAQILNETIETLTFENEGLKGQISNLNEQISNLDEILASDRVNPQQTREFVNRLSRDFSELEMKANSLSYQTDIAKSRNQNLVNELEKKFQ